MNTHRIVFTSSMCLRLFVCFSVSGCTYSLQEHRCLDVVVVDHTELGIVVDDVGATKEIPEM